MSEIDIVRATRRALYYMAPEVKFVAIPNGAKRSQWEAMRARQEGMCKGFPDAMCLWPGGGLAYIEFKTTKGRVSEDQREWIELLTRYGFHCTVARSADEAIEFLRSCGAPIRGHAA